jgi:hypothetical protein
MIRLALAVVLAGAALAKLASPRSSAAALGTFGIAGGRLRWVAWGILIAAELGLAAGVAAGSDEAAWAAAAMTTAFGLALVSAILRGRAGAPCACFGSRSKVSWLAVARNLLLAGAFAAVSFVPVGELSTEEWLGIGLGVALLACAGLGVALLALAREVGMLRLRLGPDSALEIPDEGPPLGKRAALIDRFDPGPHATLALAVFTSQGCHLCRSLEPSIAALAREPTLALRGFDEGQDAEAWKRLEVPGSPYGLAMDLDGTVLAKGTFNSLSQLESILATAERRRPQAGPQRPIEVSDV